MLVPFRLMTLDTTLSLYTKLPGEDTPGWVYVLVDTNTMTLAVDSLLTHAKMKRVLADANKHRPIPPKTSEAADGL
jgi:hypothetical protein